MPRPGAIRTSVGNRWSRQWLYGKLGLYITITGYVAHGHCRSPASRVGHITLDRKRAGKPIAGIGTMGLKWRVTGNQLTVWLLRHSQRKREHQLGRTYGAGRPVLDPTLELGSSGPPLLILYVIVPWIGVMMAGYALWGDRGDAGRTATGHLHEARCGAERRLRGPFALVNVYGDPQTRGKGTS